ncbi:hypothetical protein Barb7_02644 [Bacteroidales bacterium Barb7]|nr:hypothetical protein Barb7_02644 [Bacteroidales bacterium Barb7]
MIAVVNLLGKEIGGGRKVKHGVGVGRRPLTGSHIGLRLIKIICFWNFKIADLRVIGRSDFRLV